MQARMRESEYCQHHAEHAIRQRRKAEENGCRGRGSTLIEAMVREQALIRTELSGLGLSQQRLTEYVLNNSSYVRSDDGKELIQIIWGGSVNIFIHRLLTNCSEEAFQANWLGVWSELDLSSDEGLSRKLIEKKVKHRLLQKELFDINK